MTAYTNVSGLKYEEATASLGDELRAARATRGLSIQDVEADLRIKAHYIEAIEAGDLSTLPGKVYVDGFVRNYATYLGLDPIETLRRFDAQSGFAEPQGKLLRRNKSAAASDDPLAGFQPRRKDGGSVVGGMGRGIASLWPLVVLAGLGYGLWYGVMAAREAGMIPDNLSVIGAVDEEQPVFSANVSDDDAKGGSGAAIERPADLSYAKLGTEPYWSQEDDTASDGPLSGIDVASVGLFSSHRDMIGGSALVRGASPLDLTPQPPAAVEAIAAETREALLTPAEAMEVPGARDFALVATEEAWIEVKALSGSILFSGILAPGEAFDVPDTAGLSLKVGNAGGLTLELDGERLGAFGASGAVVRRVDLGRDALVERFAQSETASIR